MPEHRLFDLTLDHRARATEVLADLVDLPGSDGEEVQVALERVGVRLTARCLELAPLRADEVMNEDFVGGLAVTVDAAVALLEAVGVPRDLGVHEAVAALLKRDAL